MTIFSPLGLFVLRQKITPPNTVFDPRSGKKGFSKPEDIPYEIKSWNFGAFSLPLHWGVYYGVWQVLLTLIPLVSMFFIFYLGFRGNEFAWKSQQWTSVEEFQHYSRKWNNWGIAIFALRLISVLGFFAAMGIATSLVSY